MQTYASSGTTIEAGCQSVNILTTLLECITPSLRISIILTNLLYTRSMLGVKNRTEYRHYKALICMQSINLVIGFSRCFVGNIKIKTPMILCALSTLSSCEHTFIMNRSSSENMRKVCLFYSQNNKTFC